MRTALVVAAIVIVAIAVWVGHLYDVGDIGARGPREMLKLPRKPYPRTAMDRDKPLDEFQAATDLGMSVDELIEAGRRGELGGRYEFYSKCALRPQLLAQWRAEEKRANSEQRAAITREIHARLEVQLREVEVIVTPGDDWGGPFYERGGWRWRLVDPQTELVYGFGEARTRGPAPEGAPRALRCVYASQDAADALHSLLGVVERREQRERLAAGAPWETL